MSACGPPLFVHVLRMPFHLLLLVSPFEFAAVLLSHRLRDIICYLILESVYWRPAAGPYMLRIVLHPALESP